MLSNDIETEEAVRRLTVPDRGGISRRRFLQAAALGAGGVVAANSLPRFVRDAYGASPIGPTDGVLILVQLNGGNDGLNTVVPISSGAYYGLRPNLAIAASDAIGLNADFGLHPRLTFVADRFRAGQVAIVNGLGYPDPDQSHFTSLARWMQGWGGAGTPKTGWLGRWTDQLPADPGVGATRSICIDDGVPLHLLGARTQAASLAIDQREFGSHSDIDSALLYRAVRDMALTTAGYPLIDAMTRAGRDNLDVTAEVTPSYVPKLSGDRTVRKFTLAARLVNADIGVRVLNLMIHGFDNHSGEPPDHAARMTELNDGLQAFFATLSPRFATRTTVMTFSEFGRRPNSNDSTGTDHGTANCAFVIGSRVNGGFHGQLPSLTVLDRDDQMVHTVDFRSVYATMIERWLGGDSTALLGASYPQLDLFNAAPGGGVDASMPPTSVRGGFVSVSPLRQMDTRDGTGALGALGAEQVIELLVAGRGEVPPDATAVTMNVTATEATASSYLTVWPTGEERPTASNLNFSAGQTVPNLVVCKIGAGGKVSFFNHAGSVQVVADVVGYNTPAGGQRLMALVPARLIDTRETGNGPVGSGGVLALPVLGVGGVPLGGVDAVVLNVTVAEPTDTSFVTVWPAGEPQPTASSLNFVRGQTVPNLVIAKVGAGGVVSMYNHAGSTHLIADVVGYFSTDPAGAQNVPVTPVRLLDTRNTAEGRIGGQGVRRLTVAGVMGVPANARAVTLNVTVTEPSHSGYVTVWPAGEGRPTASNLNFVPGQSIANLVVAKVGEAGAIDIFNSRGASHVVVDLVSYYLS